MHPLTPREIAAERAEAQAEDAAERLAAIRDAQNECLAACKLAVEKFADAVDAQGMRGFFAHQSITQILEQLREGLDEGAHSVVSDLEDMECGTGHYDLAALADEAAEARADAEREERGLRGAS